MKLTHSWHSVYYSETISYSYEMKWIGHNSETTSYKYEMKLITFQICMKEFIALLKNKILQSEALKLRQSLGKYPNPKIVRNGQQIQKL